MDIYVTHKEFLQVDEETYKNGNRADCDRALGLRPGDSLILISQGSQWELTPEGCSSVSTHRMEINATKLDMVAYTYSSKGAEAGGLWGQGSRLCFTALL